ncbi:acyl-CoA dehydratase activase-related protein [Desulfotomaculum copahuensis]|uniref:DUF2229 domain-containing protein n=1 Tax=Desulfotomaculum copahuensis TaxID=1838280 RepID=A0A1B7LEN8_9FIRM|nr:acyl-CoA dehydratase activase-related protein [Desulfotomaculum copahuensis]OAT81744.1 hypothetical protein A6M21_10080 [Desulfotomaculum copahuensis]
MSVRVGIPGALLYYLYYPAWSVFFRSLGAEVVSSGRTTSEMLDQGVREALADACVPVKLYFGHVMTLAQKVDYLFIPRVVCLNKETTYCPKFLGMPDMIRHSIPDLPPMIDVRLDAREGWNALRLAYRQAAEMLGAGRWAADRAYWKAAAAERRLQALLQKGCQPPEAIKMLNRGVARPVPETTARASTGMVFAVLGYPYIIHDQYISLGMLPKLQKMGVRVVTAENLPHRQLMHWHSKLDKRLFWTFSDLCMRATEYLYARGGVDGIIHLTAFGCGPDSLLDKFMEMKAREQKTIPFMSLTIDEQSGEAGVATRLEAFVDMVRRKKGALPGA